MDPNKDEVVSPATSTDQPNAEAASEAVETVAAEIDANAAESSSADATDANDRISLLSVITDAVKPKDEAAAESSTAESEAEPGKEEAAAEEAATDDEPDDSKLPFHEHPRWKQVLAERDALRDPADRYTAVTSFMEQNNLAPEEVSEGFEVMALLKRGDPASLQKALEWFEPRYEALRGALGVDLPADLQERVDDGSLDADTAAELAEARAKVTLTARRDEAEATRSEEARVADAAKAAALAAATAVNGWEAQIRKTDPDFAEKAEMVETTVRAEVAMKGPPKTPEEAVAIVQGAYEKVTKTFQRLKPPPKAKDTTTPAGTSARTVTQPATLREAIEASLAA